MKKRILSLALVLAMALSFAATALAAHFTDVPEKAWYYKDVESAVAQGLVNGTSATTYSPDKNLTYAEAVKLAACMHKKVTKGNTDFEAGSPWYQPYVDYAKANGIITKDYTWSANATRAGYMEIFANAIPSTGLRSGYTALSEINKVDDGTIPDVSMSHPQATAIYKLYRAGILQGNDELHSCYPASAIKRSEVAAILTRMMDVEKRVSFTMDGGTVDLKITTQPVDATAAPGDRAEYTVAVTGGKGPFTYTWFQSADGTSWTRIVNDSNFSGVSTAVLSVKAGDATANRVYRCEVTDAAKGKAVSAAAKLTLGASTLKVTIQPQSVAAAEDEWVSFTVAVSGGKTPYTYRWEMKDENMADFSPLPLDNPSYVKNADTVSLGIRADSTDWNYDNQYRCKVTDAAGSVVYSDSASISEKSSAALSITAQPTDSYPLGKGTAEFSVKANGGKLPYSYEWFASLNPNSDEGWESCDDESYIYLSGARSDRLSVKVNEGYVVFYRCVITDAAGNKVTSKPAEIRLTGADVFMKSSRGITYVGTDSTAVAYISVTLQDWCEKTYPNYRWQFKAPESSEWQYCSGSGFSGAATAELSFRDNIDRFSSNRKMSGYSFRCEVVLWGETVVYSDAVTDQ